MPTTLPFRSLVWTFFSPMPPRLWRRYSSSSVRLPNPRSQTVSSVAPSLTTFMATTSSPSRSWIPRTPRALRPIGRASSSWNRMAMPLRVPMTRSLVPSVSATAIS